MVYSIRRVHRSIGRTCIPTSFSVPSSRGRQTNNETECQHFLVVVTVAAATIIGLATTLTMTAPIIVIETLGNKPAEAAQAEKEKQQAKKQAEPPRKPTPSLSVAVR
mmetsp:Transcript_9659/g.14214  ORF Transcript_9659/g.14214 Transcript_9659/m.14214 type:complete len:107 (-) Transcript_9659:1239-1559(-)